MSIINDVVMAVMGMAQAAVDGYTLHRGPLLPGPDISMEPDPSGAQTYFFDKNAVYSLGLVFNGKSQDMAKITGDLGRVQGYLTRSHYYPAGQAWQILRILPQSTPAMIERQDDGYWVYACSVSVEFYYRGDD